MATRKIELYDEDFYAWSQDQAAALRQLADERRNGPLDLEHSPAVDPRPGWIETIDDARDEIAERLTPTIRGDLEAHLPEIYARALRRARKALVRAGEPEAADGLPEKCPYALDQLLDEAWYPASRLGLSSDVYPEKFTGAEPEGGGRGVNV